MVNVFSIDGKVSNEIKLPKHFKEEIRPDLIKRAVLSVRSSKIQPTAPKEGAGNDYSTYLSKRRREYRGSYGAGRSRTPRKVISRKGSRFVFKGAKAPQTIGGRVAHPPKIEKILFEDINKKERRKAIRSAISATAIKEIVIKRGHKAEKLAQFPFIVEDKIETLSKTKEVIDFLKKIGLEDELKRISIRKVRAGRGKMRGRKYKTRVGPLFVVSKKCSLLNAAKNLQGADVVLVKNLNAELLAPGTHPGRLTIWSEGAIKELENKKLFM